MHCASLNAYPELRYFLAVLQLQHEFRNKIFDELPQRMYQLANVQVLMQKHAQSGKRIEEKGVYAVSAAELSNFTSVENIIGMLIAAIFVRLSTNRDTAKILEVVPILVEILEAPM